MQITRTLNVLTLTALLILTGCFGMTEDGITPPAEGEETATGTATATINNPPMIAQSEILNDVLSETLDEDSNANYNDTTEALESFTVKAYYAAIDIDGDSMTMGWDTNLDGTVDVAVTDTSGITTMDIPIAHWNELNTFDYDDYYHAMIAFIAVDEHGLGASSFHEFIAIDWSQFEEENNDGGLVMYSFAGEDASGAPSAATDDNLIRVTMMQGSNINWANLRVQIEVDNAAPVTCDNPGQDSGAVCVLVPFEGDGGQFWSVGDGVTIQESGQDLCATSCTIDVTIIDTRLGAVIASIYNIQAEADQA
ncbi:hypothetical protein N9N14_03815 [Candidatus Poseidonia alphae]|nr:hypothetical protein [Candidatus Poseidonia alphae]